MIIAPDFFEHWKTKALIELTKRPESPLWVQRLWAHCQTRKQSEFKALSQLALKSICGVTGDITPAQWWDYLLQTGFTRQSGQKLIVHDWAEHNSQLIARWAGGGATAAKHKGSSGKAAAKQRTGDREDGQDGGDTKEMNERARAIYSVYPRHIGPKAALKAIKAALRTVPYETLLARTAAYGRAVVGVPEHERKYLPHPATWFNAGRYDDDPAEWGRAEKKRDGVPAAEPFDPAKPHAHTGGLEVLGEEPPSEEARA